MIQKLKDELLSKFVNAQEGIGSTAIPSSFGNREVSVGQTASRGVEGVDYLTTMDHNILTKELLPRLSFHDLKQLRATCVKLFLLLTEIYFEEVTVKDAHEMTVLASLASLYSVLREDPKAVWPIKVALSWGDSVRRHRAILHKKEEHNINVKIIGYVYRGEPKRVSDWKFESEFLLKDVECISMDDPFVSPGGTIDFTNFTKLKRISVVGMPLLECEIEHHNNGIKQKLFVQNTKRFLKEKRGFNVIEWLMRNVALSRRSHGAISFQDVPHADCYDDCSTFIFPINTILEFRDRHNGGMILWRSSERYGISMSDLNKASEGLERLGKETDETT